MIANMNPDTGLRYGVIAGNSLDPDLLEELMRGPDAVDLTYEAAYEEAELEARHKALGTSSGLDLIARALEAGRKIGHEGQILLAYIDGYIDGTGELDDQIEQALDQFSDTYEEHEPTIEGTYEGVKYRVSWLGGAPLVFVFNGPAGVARALCSPCVPGAADLDSGFELDSEMAEDQDYSNHFGCHCVPRSWLRKE